MLGWNTGFESIMPRGHETLTERALSASGPGAGGRVSIVVRGNSVDTVLSPAEVNAIVEGNRSVDVADIRYMQSVIAEARRRPYLVPLVGGAAAAFSAGQTAGHVVHSLQESDQSHHALRRNRSQTWQDGLREIILDLRAQHRGILAESNAGSRLRKIGAALHLIQDSYCPAHTERTGSCISYVRNYGPYDSPLWERSGAGREHSFPTDPRDNIHLHPVLAAGAVTASAQYLRIVFKILYGRTQADAVAILEANREFEAFIQQHFAACG
jgi:hypothetical protein